MPMLLVATDFSGVWIAWRMAWAVSSSSLRGAGLMIRTAGGLSASGLVGSLSGIFLPCGLQDPQATHVPKFCAGSQPVGPSISSQIHRSITISSASG